MENALLEALHEMSKKHAEEVANKHVVIQQLKKANDRIQELEKLVEKEGED